MKSTMAEMNLSMQDFTRYFEANRLGKLYFPNGKYVENRYGTHVEYLLGSSKFFVNLTDLYKMVSGWEVNHTLVPLDDVVAVITFGSAVRYPGVEEIPYTYKKYLLFGPQVAGFARRSLQPRDADFLVITGQDLMRETILEPISQKTYDSGTWLKRGGIHLVNRGIHQLLNGVRANDTVSVSALREGVPVFFDSRFRDVLSQACIARTTPLKILWDEDPHGFLVGRIQ